MFFMLLIIPAIIAVYLTGGSLKRLLDRPLHFKWLVLTVFLINILIFTDLPIMSDLPTFYIGIMHIISYLLLLCFIALNYKVRGIELIGVGTLSNAIAIAANGGFMPSPLIPPENIFRNVIGISPESRLLFLSDVLSSPAWLPLPEAFSIGDVFIVLGMFVYLLINSRRPNKYTAA